MPATTEITPVQESELADVQRFLVSIFNASPDHRPFRLEALRWKAFDPHPEYPGTRSVVVRHEGKIIAHGVFSPVRLRSTEGDVSAQILMDWAAEPSIPGVGVMVYQHLAALTDAQIAIAGSEDAIKMLPLLGFRPKQKMHSYRLITNAWRYHMGSTQRDWKTALRIGRDWAQRAKRSTADSGAGSFTAERVERFDDNSRIPMPDPAKAGGVVSARTPESLNHALRCPIARMEGYVISRSSSPAGYFVLSRIGAECRIAELWVDSDQPQLWLAAAELATECASANPDNGAVFSTVSSPLLQTALEQLGYERRDDVPVFLKDRKRRLPQEQPLLLTMLENDAFYL